MSKLAIYFPTLNVVYPFGCYSNLDFIRGMCLGCLKTFKFDRRLLALKELTFIDVQLILQNFM